MSSSAKPSLYVEEYLYRGRPPSSGKPGEHHVTLGCEIPDGFGGQTVHHRGPMTMVEAEAFGWPLSKITDEINGETADSLQKTTAELEAVRSELDDVKIDLARHKEGLDMATRHIEAMRAVEESLRQQLLQTAGVVTPPAPAEAPAPEAPAADEPAPAADR